MSTMEVPAHVYATMAAVVDKFPHTGSDDERRAAMEKVVATLRARHGLRWVWKTEHANLMAPSKDGLGYVPEGEVVHGRLTTMFIWDTINGSSRRLNPAPLVSEEARPAYVLAVEPKDWLAGAGEPWQPPTTPPTQPPVFDIEARFLALEADLRKARDMASGAYARGDSNAEAIERLADRVGRLKVKATVDIPLKAAIDIPVVATFSHPRPRAKGDVEVLAKGEVELRVTD